jgi:thymidylate kinase
LQLIYLFGADGTGKTTHADLLALYLAGMGVRVHRATVKQHHTLAYLLLKALETGAVRDSGVKYNGFEPTLRKKIKTPWKILELLSLFPAMTYRVLIPLLLGRTVICDRYAIDSLVTLSHFLGDTRLLCGSTARILLLSIPRDSLLIHLDGDTASLLARKKDEPLTSETIDYYRKAYGKIARFLPQVVKLNTTSADLSDVQKKLRSLADSYLARRNLG